jgi:hypothetical protein
MRRSLLVFVVALAAFGVACPAAAANYRNFVSLTGGVNDIWNPLAEGMLAILEQDTEAGYGGTLGYGTRLGRDSRFVLFAGYGLDRLRLKDEMTGEDTDFATLHQLRANIRYYIGPVSERPAAYVGLGPDLMFDGDDVGVNVNLSLGGDFPVGHGWSILVDATLDAVVAYGQVGLAYWFE